MTSEKATRSPLSSEVEHEASFELVDTNSIAEAVRLLMPPDGRLSVPPYTVRLGSQKKKGHAAHVYFRRDELDRIYRMKLSLKKSRLLATIDLKLRLNGMKHEVIIFHDTELEDDGLMDFLRTSGPVESMMFKSSIKLAAHPAPEASDGMTIWPKFLRLDLLQALSPEMGLQPKAVVHAEFEVDTNEERLLLLDILLASSAFRARLSPLVLNHKYAFGLVSGTEIRPETVAWLASKSAVFGEAKALFTQALQ